MRSAVSSKETAKIWYLRIQGSRVGRWSSLNLQSSSPMSHWCSKVCTWAVPVLQWMGPQVIPIILTKPYGSGHSVERANPTTSWYLTKRSAGKNGDRSLTWLIQRAEFAWENRNCSGTIISSTHQIWNTTSRSLEQEKAVQRESLSMSSKRPALCQQHLDSTENGSLWEKKNLLCQYVWYKSKTKSFNFLTHPGFPKALLVLYYPFNSWQNEMPSFVPPAYCSRWLCAHWASSSAFQTQGPFNLHLRSASPNQFSLKLGPQVIDLCM